MGRAKRNEVGVGMERERWGVDQCIAVCPLAQTMAEKLSRIIKPSLPIFLYIVSLPHGGNCYG